MAVPLISCPLCSQPGFNTLESLRDSLIGSATRQIVCPVCHDVLIGLDKFTIHLFSHFFQNSYHQQQRYNSPSQASLIDTLCKINAPQLIQNVAPQIAKPPDNMVQISYNIHHNSNVVTHQPQSSGHSLRKSPNPVGACNKSTKEAKNSTNTSIDKLVAAPHKKLPVRFVEQQAKTQYVESAFENVTLLESCGLKQDAQGIVSKTHEVADDVGPSTLIEPRENVQRQTSADAQATAGEETTGSNIRCQLCNFSFPDEHILFLHRQLVHNNGDAGNEKKPFGCYLCSKEFKMRGSLMVHLRVAHGGSSNLRNIAAKDDALPAKQYNCSSCGKTFKKEQHLSQHMKTHEGKQWPCDTCQKLFTTKYFLKKHKRLHTGEMPYSCPVCAKTFTFQQSMRKHALYHRDDKPHACAECNRTFKELSTLQNHRRIHTGEKPFACESCGKCFRQRVSYLVHRRIHTGIMPYRCTACGKNFRYKVSERTHKCPSHPPGVVVRQTGDLVQKLQQRAALQATETKPSDQQLLNTNQFIIVLDGNTQQKVYVSQQVGDTNDFSDKSDKPVQQLKEKSKESSGIEGLDLMVETADFFSMVDNMPSPAERMRNLSISSPIGHTSCIEDGSRNQLQPDILQTINEDSIKQFLYNNQM